MIHGCQFLKNRVEKGPNGLTLLFADLSIVNTVFTANEAQDKTDCIFTIYSNITLSNVQFTAFHSSDAFASRDLSIKKGAFLFVSSETVIRYCQFRKRWAQHGGAVFILGDAQVTMERVVFEDNVAQLGGAIYASNFKSLLLKEATFTNNLCQQSVACNLYATYSQ